MFRDPKLPVFEVLGITEETYKLIRSIDMREENMLPPNPMALIISFFVMKDVRNNLINPISSSSKNNSTNSKTIIGCIYP